MSFEAYARGPTILRVRKRNTMFRYWVSAECRRGETGCPLQRLRLCAAFNKTASYTTSRRGGAGGPAGHANILCSGQVASVPSDSICSLSGWQSAPEASGFMIECVTNFSDPGSSGSTAMQRWKALALPWKFVFI